MASSSTSSHSRRSKSTNATTVTTKTKVTASSRGYEFERHLIDHHIYPAGYLHPDDRPTPLPNNIDEFASRLAAPRGSLSPSQFPESSFRDFQRKNDAVIDEGDVMRDVVPLLCGNSSIPSRQNTIFTNFEPITSEDASRAKPDLFDGAYPHKINRDVRYDDEVHTLIIPTKHPTVPVAPNFFLEAKCQDGSAAVMKRQACYDGAYGARAMYSLQNYGKDEPVYDNNAYAFSSTYHDGTLKLYAHHPTAPTTPAGRPEYHMTQLKAYALTNDRETLVEGATAFRNARDVAERHRDSFIEAATPERDNLMYQPAMSILSIFLRRRIQVKHLQCWITATRRQVSRRLATAQTNPALSVLGNHRVHHLVLQTVTRLRAEHVLAQADRT